MSPDWLSMPRHPLSNMKTFIQAASVEFIEQEPTLPCINGVELNSPQYTPAANLPWLPTLSGIFEPRGGVHTLDDASCPGLGSSLKPL